MVPQRSLKIETLGDLGNYSLYASCGPCHRTVQFDFDALVARYGGDTPIRAFKARLRCDRCKAPGELTIGTKWG